MILDPQEILKAERHLIEGGINPESLMDEAGLGIANACLLYTSPSPRD